MFLGRAALLVALLMACCACGIGVNAPLGAPAGSSGPTPSDSPTAPVSPRLVALSSVAGGGTTLIAEFDVPMNTSSVAPADFSDVHAVSGGSTQTTVVVSLGGWTAGNTKVTLTLQNFIPASGEMFVTIASGSVTSAGGQTNSAASTASVVF